MGGVGGGRPGVRRDSRCRGQAEGGQAHDRLRRCPGAALVRGVLDRVSERRGLLRAARQAERGLHPAAAHVGRRRRRCSHDPLGRELGRRHVVEPRWASATARYRDGHHARIRLHAAAAQRGSGCSIRARWELCDRGPRERGRLLAGRRGGPARRRDRGVRDRQRGRPLRPARHLSRRQPDARPSPAPSRRLQRAAVPGRARQVPRRAERGAYAGMAFGRCRRLRAARLAGCRRRPCSPMWARRPSSSSSTAIR